MHALAIRHGQIVRFAAGGNQHTDLESVGKGRGESIAVLHDELVEIAGIGIEGCGLRGECLHHPGVTVPDLRTLL